MALNNVPLTGQSLNFTRPLVNSNFSSINTAFAVDHIAFNDPGQGKHKAVHFVNQAVAPTAPVTAAGEVALYAAPSINGTPGTAALWFKGASSILTVNGIDFTTSGNGTDGWARLASGILLKWGSGSGSGSLGGAAIDVTYPTSGATIPAFTAVYTVQVQAMKGGSDGNVACVLNTFSNPLKFTVNLLKMSGSDSVTVNFTYLAIGI